MNTPSITFTGPNGWKYTSKVQDKAALAKVKVGDKVDIVWTEAVLVSARARQVGAWVTAGAVRRDRPGPSLIPDRRDDRAEERIHATRNSRWTINRAWRFPVREMASPA